MALGPGPPMKKGGKDRGSRTGSRRELATAGQGSSMGSSADTTIVAEGGSPELENRRLSREGWNRRRYQREDEELWGYDGSDADGFDGTDEGRRGSSIGLAGLGRAGNPTPYRYYLARNPAVNDLHPPVVSTQPTHKSETRWMLQPPPSAKIMEGKVRANRSRSGSGGSSRRGGEAVSLGRRVGERLMEEKVKRGVRPPTGEFLNIERENSKDCNVGGDERHTQGQPHDRNMRKSMESVNSIPSQRRTRPPPIMTPCELRSPALAMLAPSKPPSMFESQPSLRRSTSSTCPNITSHTKAESSSPPTHYPPASKSQSNHPQPVRTFTDSTNSLHTLQDLSTTTTTHTDCFNPPVNAHSDSRNAGPCIKLPALTSREETEWIQLPECET